MLLPPGTAPAQQAEPLSLPYVTDFDSPAAPGPWQVLNEDAMSYVRDAGEIYQIASGGKASFLRDGAANIHQMVVTPDGDFDMQLSARLEAKTGHEGVWLGLYDGADAFVAAHLSVNTKGCGSLLSLSVVNQQSLALQEEVATTQFSDDLFDDGPLVRSVCNDEGRAQGDALIAALATQGFTLTLERRGPLYAARLQMADPAGGAAIDLRSAEVLRLTAPGRPAFTLGQTSRAGSGESTAQFTRFSITAPAS
ncbi:hypothetical protein KUV28_06835 [Ferrimonas balearica]|nr:hypothetical protein [Ferrimonas balearica]